MTGDEKISTCYDCGVETCVAFALVVVGKPLDEVRCLGCARKKLSGEGSDKMEERGLTMVKLLRSMRGTG